MLQQKSATEMADIRNYEKGVLLPCGDAWWRKSSGGGLRVENRESTQEKYKPRERAELCWGTHGHRRTRDWDSSPFHLDSKSLSILLLPELRRAALRRLFISVLLRSGGKKINIFSLYVTMRKDLLNNHTSHVETVRESFFISSWWPQ